MRIVDCNKGVEKVGNEKLKIANREIKKLYALDDFDEDVAKILSDKLKHYCEYPFVYTTKDTPSNEAKIRGTEKGFCQSCKTSFTGKGDLCPVCSRAMHEVLVVELEKRTKMEEIFILDCENHESYYVEVYGPGMNDHNICSDDGPAQIIVVRG